MSAWTALTVPIIFCVAWECPSSAAALPAAIATTANAASDRRIIATSLSMVRLRRRGRRRLPAHLLVREEPLLFLELRPLGMRPGVQALHLGQLLGGDFRQMPDEVDQGPAP